MLLEVGGALVGQAIKNIEDGVAHCGSGSLNLVFLHLDCLFKCNLVFYSVCLAV